jgi:hypothetical protein
MKTRQDYISNKINHREYYGQFVTDSIKQTVISCIGLDKIKKSKDEHFNDIPLGYWDACWIPHEVRELLKEANDFWTLAGQTCILKECARQIKGGA